MVNFHNVELSKTAYKAKDYPEILPEFVFVGRSNVGKSSMLNKLLYRKNFARVSAEPGKTRSINFYKVDKQLFLTDLPGYGFAKVSWDDREKWRHFIEDYFNSNRKIRLVIMIVDSRHAPSNEDKQMVDYLFSTNYDFMVVASKTDKLSKTKVQENLKMIAEELDIDAEILPFSAVTGEGVDHIRNIIAENYWGGEPEEEE